MTRHFRYFLEDRNGAWEAFTIQETDYIAEVAALAHAEKYRGEFVMWKRESGGGWYVLRGNAGVWDPMTDGAPPAVRRAAENPSGTSGTESVLPAPARIECNVAAHERLIGALALARAKLDNLQTAYTEVLAENAAFRRTLESLTRKAKK